MQDACETPRCGEERTVVFVPVEIGDGFKRNGFRGVVGTGASLVCDFREWLAHPGMPLEGRDAGRSEMGASVWVVASGVPDGRAFP